MKKPAGWVLAIFAAGVGLGSQVKQNRPVAVRAPAGITAIGLRLSSVSPTAVHPGDVIRIAGNGFGAQTGKAQFTDGPVHWGHDARGLAVQVGGATWDMQVKSWTNTLVEAIVPDFPGLTGTAPNKVLMVKIVTADGKDSPISDNIVIKPKEVGDLGIASLAVDLVNAGREDTVRLTAHVKNLGNISMKASRIDILRYWEPIRSYVTDYPVGGECTFTLYDRFIHNTQFTDVDIPMYRAIIGVDPAGLFTSSQTPLKNPADTNSNNDRVDRQITEAQLHQGFPRTSAARIESMTATIVKAGNTSVGADIEIKVSNSSVQKVEHLHLDLSKFPEPKLTEWVVISVDAHATRTFTFSDMNRPGYYATNNFNYIAVLSDYSGSTIGIVGSKEATAK